MLEKVAFTMYPAKDVARARKFYGEVLGLKEGSVGNQGEGWWVEYDLPGGGCFAITNFTQDEPSANGGTITRTGNHNYAYTFIHPHLQRKGNNCDKR